MLERKREERDRAPELASNSLEYQPDRGREHRAADWREAEGSWPDCRLEAEPLGLMVERQKEYEQELLRLREWRGESQTLQASRTHLSEELGKLAEQGITSLTKPD
jgi:hypothetical protein